MSDNAKRQDLPALLDEIEAIPGDDVAVSDLEKLFGRRSFGPMLIIAGLLATLPTGLIPGMTWGTGAIMLLIFVQLLFGAHRLILPRFVNQRSLSRARVKQAVDIVRPWAVRVSRIAKPRLEFFLQAPLIQLVSISGILMALTMFPLGPVPFGAFPGGVSAIVIGIGFVVRDGLFMAAGLVIGAVGVVGSLALISFL